MNNKVITRALALSICAAACASQQPAPVAPTPVPETSVAAPTFRVSRMTLAGK